MKKIILGMLVLGAITSTSCKKDKDDPSCEKSVAGITGNYKIVKYEIVAGPQTTDQTAANYDACQLAGVYALKADKTVTYSETGTGCTGTFTGTWDVVDSHLTISDGSFTLIDNLPITTWDCSNLTVSDVQSTAAGDVGDRLTFKKQ